MIHMDILLFLFVLVGARAPDFDISELESLFSAAVPNSEHGSTGRKSNRHASRSKLEKAQLVSVEFSSDGAHCNFFPFHWLKWVSCEKLNGLKLSEAP